jgi:hypothetical protein
MQRFFFSLYIKPSSGGDLKFKYPKSGHKWEVPVHISWVQRLLWLEKDFHVLQKIDVTIFLKS